MLNKVKHNFCKKPVCNTCISLKHKIYSKFIDNSNAVLTLSCDGDLNFSSSTKILAPTTTSTTMTTTQRTTTQSLTTKTAKTPGITKFSMTTSENVKTNLQLSTVPGSGTSNILTTNYFKSASIKTTSTYSAPTTEINNQEHSTTSTACKILLYSYFSIKTRTADEVLKVTKYGFPATGFDFKLYKIINFNLFYSEKVTECLFILCIKISKFLSF